MDRPALPARLVRPATGFAAPLGRFDPGEPARRQLATNTVLAGAFLLLVHPGVVLTWLAAASAVALAGPAVAAKLPKPKRSRAETLSAWCALYAAPAVLAVLGLATGGAAGGAAAAFVFAALAIQGLSSGAFIAAFAEFKRWRAKPRPERSRPAPARTASVAETPAAPMRAPSIAADSGRMMRTLLSDLLDLQRWEAGRLTLAPTDFDLRNLLAATVRTWKPEARRRGLDFALSGADKAPRWVQGDPIRIRQILDTLLANALKFTAQGSVSLNVAVEPAGEGAVKLTVSIMDTGPGMTAEQFAGVFNAYDVLDVSARRAGPGLARHLARELARLMGGELTASSAPGLGAIFSLSIPLKLAAGGRKDVDTARGLRVLVVDDHAVYRQAFALILQSVCREVVCAEDGVQALDLLASQPFDLVLMDLSMPKLGGLAATRRLRASSSAGKDVAVIALTASVSEADRTACLAAGMNGFVSKPVDARELLAAVHAVLSGEEISQAA